jgi:AbrB family looped-hinge helix DNA binding protein
MERRIDQMGRVVIPSEFRKQLRINDGDALDLNVENDKLVITKVNTKPSDIRRERVFVFDADKVKATREKYPIGTIVECINMGEEARPVPTGTRGVVNFVDDMGSIHVNWENSSSLALIEEIDRFKVIK